MGRHQPFFFELFESHVSEVIDSLLPGELSHVVVSNFNQILREDFESIFGLLGIWRVELGVDFFGFDVSEDFLAIDEGAILDVEMEVAE